MLTQICEMILKMKPFPVSAWVDVAGSVEAIQTAKHRSTETHLKPDNAARLNFTV